MSRFDLDVFFLGAAIALRVRFFTEFSFYSLCLEKVTPLAKSTHHNHFFSSNSGDRLTQPKNPVNLVASNAAE
ncbi:MAG: hypothetical protein WBB82_00530 [Limnothrix sp.]